MLRITPVIIFAILCRSIPVTAQQDSLLLILTNELKREQQEFTKIDQPPYFFSYRVNDIKNVQLLASFGSLTKADKFSGRLLTLTLRVGSYQTDNTHPENESEDDRENTSGSGYLPVDNNRDAISYLLWETTQRVYRKAREDFKSVKNSQIASKYKGPDFSMELPQELFEKPLDNVGFDQKSWEDKIRKYSQPFKKNPDVIEGDVSLTYTIERKYYVSTEGTRIVQNIPSIYLNINGSIRATDGDIVPLHRSHFAFKPADLPDDTQILLEIDQLIAKLAELRKAPRAEPYSGPAILDAQAAGVFFHEIFGHRIEGHRLRSETDGQTFKEKINQPVLSKTLNVIFDPTLETYNKRFLNGHYLFDDEGVKSRRVQIVENGILKTFLLSRAPLPGFFSSNGHGRAAAGADAVSRQSNLIVETTKTHTPQELRKMLIQEAKKQKKSYGYFCFFASWISIFLNS